MLDYEKEYEKKCFKQMSFKEKLGHIWEYYKVHIALILAGILVAVWCLNHFWWNPPEEIGLCVIAYDDSISYNQSTPFEKYMEEEMSKHEIPGALSFTALMDYESNIWSSSLAENSSTKITAMIAAKELDLLIGRPETLALFVEADYLTPLTDIFTEQELQEISEAIQAKFGEEAAVPIAYVQVQSLDGKSDYERKPYMISLQGLTVCENLFAKNFVVYLAVPYNAPHVDALKTMVHAFVFGE